ncbi:transaldolase family protein [Marinilabilia salmonicolor]|uniref:Fructose-6-phosphate aldolase 2 n=1 Tax=Marinilabilia salmonicolor TaxID=989 RepID=A0A368UUQ6_9BACT|nr:transaldolase family protein [Marinilabilia salmonicolor]RCW32532.1 fructose-6-phosphate aldolase 2 [Marinilabilia salmonicolor]
MYYLADTANTEEIKKLLHYFPLQGITTNPTILAAEGKKLSVILPELVKLAGDKMLHIQMISEKAERMVDEAGRYREQCGDKCDFYAKVPITEEGYRAIPMLKRAGIKVTATAIFTHQQALVAARAGANFVAPYVNRLDNISSHGIEVVSHIVKSFNDFKLPTKVLAASFKTVDQVHRVTLTGCYSATISFELLERLRSHPMTNTSVESFLKDGKDLYDIPF